MSEYESRAAARLARYRLPGEQIKVAMQEHWAAKIEPCVTAGGTFLMVLLINGFMPPELGILSTFAWWLWFILLLRCGWELVNWQISWFVVTNRRLLLLYGIFNRRVAMMPMSKVTDMSYSRSPLGMFLGYGTFILESAGQEQALSRITFVRNPDVTYRTICSQIFRDPFADAPAVDAPPDPKIDPGDGQGPGGGGGGPKGGPPSPGDRDPDVPRHEMGDYLVDQNADGSIGRRFLRGPGPEHTDVTTRPRSMAAEDDPGWQVSHEDASDYERVPRDAPQWWR